MYFDALHTNQGRHPIVFERFGILSFQVCLLRWTILSKKAQDPGPWWVYRQEAGSFEGDGERALDRVDLIFAFRFPQRS